MSDIARGLWALLLLVVLVLALCFLVPLLVHLLILLPGLGWEAVS